MRNGTAVVVANKPLTDPDDHHILMNVSVVAFDASSAFEKGDCVVNDEGHKSLVTIIWQKQMPCPRKLKHRHGERRIVEDGSSRWTQLQPHRSQPRSTRNANQWDDSLSSLKTKGMKANLIEDINQCW
ncbi:CLUMA_CG002818, isoform A [Clunio marinus]|uniref:CLUMA_CG002818, isoform A n=1 Tax=Clunio marinus TaxID=568069 RepID=A0A1J1HRU8_9DIPT|nr:CLUMA_CG002818, isoform A [Clunio marinus]